jgi:hypothetical protein
MNSAPDGRLRGVVVRFGVIRPIEALMSDRARDVVFDPDAAGFFTEGASVTFELGAGQDGQPRAIRMRRVS